MFPRLIQIGSYTLPTYGVLVAIAFLVALAMASRFAKQRGLDKEKVVNLGVYCALVGMLGAKLLMIALDPEYRAHPGRFFAGNAPERRYLFRRSSSSHSRSRFSICGRSTSAGAGDMRRFCAWTGDRPWHRAARMLRNGLLLGQANALALGRDIHQSERNDGRTARKSQFPLHPTQLYEAFAEVELYCVVLVMQLRDDRIATGRSLDCTRYSMAGRAVRRGVPDGSTTRRILWAAR